MHRIVAQEWSESQGRNKSKEILDSGQRARKVYLCRVLPCHFPGRGWDEPYWHLSLPLGEEPFQTYGRRVTHLAFWNGKSHQLTLSLSGHPVWAFQIFLRGVLRWLHAPAWRHCIGRTQLVPPTNMCSLERYKDSQNNHGGQKATSCTSYCIFPTLWSQVPDNLTKCTTWSENQMESLL